ncbi:hypothetical protein CLH39_10105 [Alcaligenes faecalis]|uniref:AraC family transcriptional regulator n=1 Tax=Alcaligenes faecalis TaxID=511 RepID=UPI0019335BCE|nr:AraC family transcriptional regulator [Alcaligenes faecalis]QRF90564.1 hypothetical protein CLH39_10105 [Alcaligenes faecalis]
MFISNDLQLGVDSLRRRESFHSKDRDETSAYAASLIAEHKLAVAGKKFDADISHSQSGHIRFVHMRFGTTVRVDPRQVNDFTLIHIPLQGASRLHHADGETILNPQVAGVVAAGSPFHIVWEPDCSQLIVLIAREKLEQACRVYFGAAYKQPLAFCPSMNMGTMGGAGWRQLVCYALLNPWPGNTIAQGHLDGTMIGHLLMHHTHNYSHIDWRGGNQGSVAPRSVKLAEQYIEERLAEPLTLFDIAQYSGVTVRTLLRNFRDCRGCSPMDALRERRLEQVHLELQRQNSQSVSDIAYQWGFTHLGRFAKLYKNRYGQAPSQTLARR